MFCTLLSIFPPDVDVAIVLNGVVNTFICPNQATQNDGSTKVAPASESHLILGNKSCIIESATMNKQQ